MSLEHTRSTKKSSVASTQVHNPRSRKEGIWQGPGECARMIKWIHTNVSLPSGHRGILWKFSGKLWILEKTHILIFAYNFGICMDPLKPTQKWSNCSIQIQATLFPVGEGMGAWPFLLKCRPFLLCVPYHVNWCCTSLKISYPTLLCFPVLFTRSDLHSSLKALPA